MKSTNGTNERIPFKDGSVYWFGFPALILFWVAFFFLRFLNPEYWLYGSFFLIPIIFAIGFGVQKCLERFDGFRNSFTVVSAVSWVIFLISAVFVLFSIT